MLASQDGLCSLKLDNYIITYCIRATLSFYLFQLNITFSSSFFLSQNFLSKFFHHSAYCYYLKHCWRQSLSTKAFSDFFSCPILCRCFANEYSLFNGKSFSHALIARSLWGIMCDRTQLSFVPALAIGNWPVYRRLEGCSVVWELCTMMIVW
jgi:hypothetical protein